jgi:hypothetical protein
LQHYTCFFQSLGQAIRVSVGGIILQNRFQIETKAFKDLSEIIERNALNEISLVQVMKGLPSHNLHAIHLKIAFARSCRVIWVVMCVLATMEMDATFFVVEYDLNQKHETNQGFMNKTESKGSGNLTVKLGVNGVTEG